MESERTFVNYCIQLILNISVGYGGILSLGCTQDRRTKAKSNGDAVDQVILKVKTSYNFYIITKYINALTSLKFVAYLCRLGAPN
jgi:hypothetical protein